MLPDNKMIIPWKDIKLVNFGCSYHPSIKVCKVKTGKSIKSNLQTNNHLGYLKTPLWIREKWSGQEKISKSIKILNQATKKQAYLICL